MGKGSKRRPGDEVKYRDNYDRIFSRCPDHPTYMVQTRPSADCPTCRRLWRDKRKEGTP